MIWKSKQNRDRKPVVRTESQRRRSARVERLEARRLFVADPIHVGIVYLETDYLESDSDVGSDSRGDRFILSFTGGAADSELTQLKITTDKDRDGLSIGDIIFDTELGGRGKNGAHPFKVVRTLSADGHAITATAEIVDGSTEMILHLTNFRAGDRLEFTLDVDEVLRMPADLTQFNQRLDVITSGQEFQDSILEATFNAPHFETAHADAVFLNDYGTPNAQYGLNIPPDEGTDIDSRPNRSAAAVATTTQVPKPIDISGQVWIDNNLDSVRQADEPLLPGVAISLWKQNSNGVYADTGHRVTTDANGKYLFAKTLGLAPGTYRVIETQPTGLFSVAAVPGTVSGAKVGNAETRDILTGINIPLGDSSAINYDFAEARPASVSGFVYIDKDNDGVRDADETGISGVTIQLVPINTISQQAVLTVTTTGNGSYTFTGLAPGSYEVIEVNQPTGLNDGIDSPGTINGRTVGRAVNPGDRIRDIVLAGGNDGIEYNFGETPYGSIAGFVYLAAPGEDCNEVHDASGNTPLSGVVVELQTNDGTFITRTTTGLDGGYRFADIPTGNYRIAEFTPTGLLDGGSHVGRMNNVTVGNSMGGGMITDITMTPSGVGVQYNFCEAAPASISGYVYHDRDDDGVRDSGEEPIAGAVLTLVGANGVTAGVATTDAQGHYEFKDVMPGEYSIVEMQPAGYLDGKDSVGTIRGTSVGRNTGGDALAAILLKQGDIGVQYNFGELRPASLFGRVHVDLDGDCILDPNEQVLSGVTIRILDSSGREVATTKTGADGTYSFTGLKPGTYTVVEEQPEGYFEGDATPGSVGGRKLDASRIGEITLGSGVVAVEYDFCERPPAQISGSVFSDRDEDCIFDSGEVGIEGARVELFNSTGQMIAFTLTDASGNYTFTNLPAGDYTVREIQPAGWLQGGQKAGSKGGDDTVQDVISRIPIGWGERLTNYNFCELEPASISGVVYVDGNGDCIRDPGEPPLSGVTIELRDASGRFISRAITDAQGRYRFDGLKPGRYQIFEQQPDGYFQGGQVPGTGEGEVLGEDLLGVRLGAGQDLVNYDFCELPPGSVGGFVYVDNDGDCERDPGEPPIVGVVIQLRDTTGKVIRQTTTDASGRYTFDGLAPGRYQIFEQQPDGVFQGGQTVGTGDGEVLGEDLLGVRLGAGQDLVNYDFCELPPGSVGGFVYVDNDGDCEFDADEPPIVGVVIQLRDTTGKVIRQTTTDASGRYTFDGLAPGQYQIFEQQPDGLFQGGQTVGTGDGEVLGEDLLGVRLGAGQHLVDYNFCELPPSSISGRVWKENQPNKIFEAGDVPIPGVLIELIGSSGSVVRQTRTDNEGNYTFINLAPGVYSVRETQPTGLFHGGEVVGDAGGSIGGDDLLVGISLRGGINAKHYDFPEVPPATISGYVFQDGAALQLPATPDAKDLRTYRDGQLTSDDTLLVGIQLELRNVLGLPFDASRALPGVYSDGPIRVTTDASGYYEFTGLRPGTYHVYQVQPNDYIDGLDTPGTTGGVAVNVADVVDDDDRIVIQTLALSEATDPRNDAILNVTLVGGGVSLNNNFSEIRISPPQFPLPEIPRPEQPHAVAPIETFDPTIRLVSFAQPLNYKNPATAYDEWAVSWHLSVINGGFPRGTLGQNGLIKGVSLKTAPPKWVEGENDKGSWTIADRDGKRDERSDSMTLGLADATALSGDFDGDGVDEGVIYKNGQWFVDFNGNGKWDEGDLWMQLGTELDRPVVGDWDGDGKDDIGIFGRQWNRDPQKIKKDPGLPDPDNKRRREVDSRTVTARDDDRGDDRKRLLVRGEEGALRADVVDHVFSYGEQVDTPIAGDWNGDGIDQIAIYRGGKWMLDKDGDGRWTDVDERATFGRPGDEPIKGDFNGDGIDEIGVVRGDLWIIDTDGDRKITGNDLKITVPRKSKDSQPVVGDFDGDGKDEPAYYDESA